MRLVKDDDDAVELMEQQDELQQQDEPEADAGAEQRIPNPTEQPDGVVDDAAEENDDAAAESSGDVEVDLRTLEALLFSTHHPLTAGRLAELLELESTKPIRRAIKDLNEQYVAGDRSFRVEQVAGGYQMLTLPEFGDILKTL